MVRFWPTTPKINRKQIILFIPTKEGKKIIELYIDHGGKVVFSLKDERGNEAKVFSNNILQEREWYFLYASYCNKTNTLQLQTQLNQYIQWKKEKDLQIKRLKEKLTLNNIYINETNLSAQIVSNNPVQTINHYNGKIENPCFFQTVLTDEQRNQLMLGVSPLKISKSKLLAYYRFEKNIETDKLFDCSTNLYHGKTYQSPSRGVTSHAWTGETTNYNIIPEHYAAIHFHEDDLMDANWEVDLTWLIPKYIKSGVYALQVKVEGDTDFIPFFIKSAPTAKKAPVLFLAPTHTYLAYGNKDFPTDQLEDIKKFTNHEIELEKQDYYNINHPEIGKSVYDLHRDGSGVLYSSRLRPIVNIRPDFRSWIVNSVRHFAADLLIVGWLENKEYRYDVATDEDLHLEGIHFLSSYEVLITGTHPEYWTRKMMVTLKRYLESGGKLMYLGGNGFYWVTGMDDHQPHFIEVRRGNAGIRNWDSPPGELYLSTTGEQGGLWRHNGFIPQEIVGVGMTAQGWSEACGYKRLPDSFDPKAKFIFEGIEKEEIIGDFGLVLNGAVGDEVDRYDLKLGTPSHTLRLATSTGLSNQYQLCHEDILYTAPGQGGSENELVRADMTYFDNDAGGAVFSTGSINWGGSLAWNNYQNNVAKISENVLNHFLNRK